MRCFPLGHAQAGPGVEAEFSDAQGRRIPVRETDSGSTRPLPAASVVAERVWSLSPAFSGDGLGKAFIFQAPARPGKGTVLLFIDAVSFKRRESPSSIPLPSQVSLRLGKRASRGDAGKERKTEDPKSRRLTGKEATGREAKPPDTHGGRQQADSGHYNLQKKMVDLEKVGECSEP